jgi:hypothetical protein
MPRNAVSHSFRLAPTVRHVAHHEHPEPVGPVELARRLDLDVRAEHVEAEPSRDQDLLAHRGVRGPGVEAVGVIALVEGHLEVDRLAVQRDVEAADLRHPRRADRAHAEVGLDDVLA